jgi:tight adherence protein C
MSTAIFSLVFGSVVMLFFAARSALAPGGLDRRLTRFGATLAPTLSEGESLVHGSETGLWGLFARIGSKHTGADATRLRDRLRHAGYRKPSAATIYYGIRVTLALGAPALVALIPALWALPVLVQIFFLIALAGVFYVLPSMYLNSRIAARQHALTRALPDALDLMVVCVEAGFGVNQSLAQVAAEFATKSPVIATEFGLVVQETRGGKSTTDALRALANRTGVTDVSSLVALLVQTERFGTSLANALRVHADAMRITRMQRAEERAQKATLKLILPSTLIFVALLILFVAPGAYMMITALRNT